MKLTPLIFLFLIFIYVPVSHAGEKNVTGFFSTFHVSEKTGDISGAEIHIVPNPVGYSAVVQASEGAPAFPEVIKLFVVENKIEFTISEESASGLPPGKYLGFVTEKGLKLSGPSGLYDAYFLPRKRSFWQ